MQPTDIISEITGHWGRWQFRTVFLIFLCKLPSAWFMACIIFTAPTPRYGEFVCHQSEEMEFFNKTTWIENITLNSAGNLADAMRLSISTESLDLAPTQSPPHVVKMDFCFEYDLNRSSTGKSCKSFEHFNKYDTLITQFDLVCSRSILAAVTQFFHLFGVLTGGILATKLLEV